MKVALNLSIRADSREGLTLLWAVPALLAGLAGLVVLSVYTTRAVREYRAVHKSYAELEERETLLRGQEMASRKDFDRPQYREVLREVQFVNGLIEKKRVSLTDIAFKLAKLLPEDARLNSLVLAPEGDDLIVRFSVTCRNEEAVDAFLNSLEDSPDFKDATVANMGFEEAGVGAGPVTIPCSARYLPNGR